MTLPGVATDPDSRPHLALAYWAPQALARTHHVGNDTGPSCEHGEASKDRATCRLHFRTAKARMREPEEYRSISTRV
jgi:hypothetical protein